MGLNPLPVVHIAQELDQGPQFREPHVHPLVLRRSVDHGCPYYVPVHVPGSYCHPGLKTEGPVEWSLQWHRGDALHVVIPAAGAVIVALNDYRGVATDLWGASCSGHRPRVLLAVSTRLHPFDLQSRFDLRR